MSDLAFASPIDLTCDGCGYDLRAQLREGRCPECGASVAESIRLSAVPRRPAWRDSDPRWRRRMLIGVWVLALLPAVEWLQSREWFEDFSLPVMIDYRGALTVRDTFLFGTSVYQPLLFCIGVVLLFARERGRRRHRFDWTRRWGVLCSYVTLLLSAAPLLFISSLVMVGIGALLQSMPLRLQPTSTPVFVRIGYVGVRYGPQPHAAADVVLVMCTSILIFLACFPLRDALRSCGGKRFAIVVLVPLALFAGVNIGHAGLALLEGPNSNYSTLYGYEWFFQPNVLVGGSQAGPFGVGPKSAYAACIEVTKWCSVLTTAIWLSIAEVATRLPRRRSLRSAGMEDAARQSRR